VQRGKVRRHRNVKQKGEPEPRNKKYFLGRKGSIEEGENPENKRKSGKKGEK